MDAIPATDTDTSLGQPSGTKRKRGRPRKKPLPQLNEIGQKDEEKFRIILSTQLNGYPNPGSTHAIRSHAMFAFRRQQRHDRASARSDIATIANVDAYSASCTTRLDISDCVSIVIDTKTQSTKAVVNSPRPSLDIHTTKGTMREARSLQFFREKSALLLPGWEDGAFWNNLVLQKSQVHSSLRHAVVALGALHEQVGIGRLPDHSSSKLSSQRAFAVEQCNRAIAHLRNQVQKIDLSVVLISCILISSFQALEDDPLSLQTWRSGLELLDDYRAGRCNSRAMELERQMIDVEIAPLLERFRIRFCSLFDLQYSLGLSMERGRNPVVSRPRLPLRFDDLKQAQCALSHLLHWTCSLVTVPLEYPVLDERMRPIADEIHRTWSTSLDESVSVMSCSGHPSYTTDDAQRAKEVLKAAQKLGYMIIQNLNTPLETAFDFYVDEFRSIVAVYDKLEQTSFVHSGNETFNFGLDNGVLETLIFLALRCRDPVVRRKAVDLLRKGNRTEGVFSGMQAVPVLEAVIAIEEAHLDRVLSCADVTEDQRIRIFSVAFHWSTMTFCLQYTRWPYDVELGAFVQEIRLPMHPCAPHDAHAVPQDVPNVIMGHGHAAFLLADSSGYFTMTTSDFHFPIPRV